jgi:hypothetical protein
MRTDRAEGSLGEQREVDGVGHFLVAGGGEVKAVAAVVFGARACGGGRFAHGRVKVDHGVEMAVGADPGVHVLADGFVSGSVVLRAAEWEDGDAVGADPSGARRGDELLVGGDQLGCHRGAGAGALTKALRPLGVM